MAIIHIQKNRLAAASWLRTVLAACAVGAVLGYALLNSDAPAPQPDRGPPVQEGSSPTVPDVNAARAERAAPVPPPLNDDTRGAAQPNMTAIQPAEAYRRARMFADCLALSKRQVEGRVLQSEASYAIDPSGATAALLQLQERERIARCRLVGPNEYRQIDELMHRAASLGDPDARLFLLDRDVQALAAAVLRERTDRIEADTSQPTDADEAVPSAAAMAAAAELRRLALEGHRPAMELLAREVLASGLLVPVDPVQAAAWNLIAYRMDRPGPLTHDDLLESGQLVDLTPEEAASALREAESLRARCCASHP